ncbi:hypothetical protein CSAL01_01050 [Colletotrichum salicis]|uniref:AB hydrolase-1 domain-containing protein n=1 Tax=Colletotrichum salicis TaxID=1209931 RepID=A0A135V561_9PEZI|nr:hypothetical protein CSAL01_01050 [Colletotrichum salicis]
MSTYQTVQTPYVAVDNTRVAYRRLGVKNKIPLLYVNHLRGSVDTLDPLLFNTIARTREVIVYDSFGIGHSEGEVPPSTEAMASIAAKFLSALGVTKADVIGFSMGGGVGEGFVLPRREVLESAGTANDEPTTKEDMFRLFYYPSETSLALGEAWWKRVRERNDGEERREYLIGPGARAQLNAIFSFKVDTDNFERVKSIKAPTLVTSGHTSIMSPTSNSFTLQKNLSNAQLIIYPDAGHGHLLQYPELYTRHLNLFLDSTEYKRGEISSQLIKMHLSAIFQVLAAALIAPGMAFPTYFNRTHQKTTTQTLPIAINDTFLVDESSQAMTLATTSTGSNLCIHASLRGLCPVLCAPAALGGDHVFYQCVHGCECRKPPNLEPPPGGQ